MTTSRQSPLSPGVFRTVVAFYIIIALALAGLGYWYYLYTKEHARRDKEEMLAVIAELKVRQLLQWRFEGTTEVEREIAEPGLVEAVRKLLSDPGNKDFRKEVRDCLAGEVMAKGESPPMLFDANANLLADPSDSTQPLNAATLKAVNHALETKKYAFSDFFLASDGQVDVDIADTLRDGQGKILGVLVQPERVGGQIGPIVHAWPISSQSGEVSLLERNGDHVVNLNELQRRSSDIQKERTPSPKSGVPAAQDILAKTGLSTGKDSRGVEFISYLLPVRGTPWFLLAKMDSEGIVVDTGYHTVVVCMLAALLVLLAGALTTFLFRKRESLILNSLIEAEKTKNQALEKYHEILLESTDGFLLVDMEGRIKEVNDAYCRMSGYSARELISMRHEDLNANESSDQLAAHRKQIAAKGSESFESCHRRKDGGICDIEVKVQYRPSEKMIAAFIRDISERKASEKKIKWLARLNNALGECNDAVLHCSNEKDMLSKICRIVVEQGGMRMAWIGMVDVASSKVLPVAAYGQRAEEYISEADISLEDNVIRGPIRTSIRENRPVWHDDLMAVADYKPWHDRVVHFGWDSLATFPIRKNGKAVGSLTIFGNKSMPFTGEAISLFARIADNVGFALENFERRQERRRSIDQLREQAELLDAAVDGIILKDLQDRIIFWNRGAEAMYGWSSAEIIGRTSKEMLFVHPEKFNQAWSELHKNGVWRGEMEKRTKDGKILAVETRWNLVRDENGNPKSILSINTDVTEHKKLEHQFIRMQKLESIGTLANGIAHDLNNTLAPILMALELLDSYVSENAGRELIETMRQSAQHGADLVKQVLSFARGAEGQRLPVSLDAVWKGIEKIIRDSFPKNITFSVKSAVGLYAVEGDPTQLHQVFMNLCVNARDAMPGGGKLDISMENTELDDVYAGLNPIAKAGSYVLVQVMDSGTGIPRDIQERIFDPFFTTKEPGSGTGVGLFTVTTIVKNHGGFINLYSEEGKGTTFRIYLPAVRFEKSVEKSPPKLSKLPKGRGETILLVDDEERVLEVAEKVLSKAGYKVLTATNGAQALALYAQHREKIAVVLTDMAMPVMDGWATIAALRAMNPEVKIIASSGLMTNSDSSSIEKLDVRHFIQKPYTGETILGALAEVLREGA